MNKIDKVILLAEKLGVDVSQFTGSYVETILKSDAYSELVKNVEWAKQFGFKKSSVLVSDFLSINYNVKNFSESVTLASRINYLSELSYENYYINPLLIADFKVKTDSIGQLVTLYDGKPTKINDIIADDSHQLNYKASIITYLVEYYRTEAIEKITYPIGKTQGNKGIASLIRGAIYRSLVYTLFLLTILVISVFILFTDRTNFKEALVFNPSNLWCYFDYGAFVLTALFSLVFTSFICYLNRKYRPYYYYKYFYKRKKAKLGSEINYEAQKLANYIFDACVNKKMLSNDIYRFAKIKTRTIGIEDYKKMYGVKTSKTYSFFKIILNILTVLVTLLILYAVGLVVYAKFIAPLF